MLSQLLTTHRKNHPSSSTFKSDGETNVSISSSINAEKELSIDELFAKAQESFTLLKESNHEMSNIFDSLDKNFLSKASLLINRNLLTKSENDKISKDIRHLISCLGVFLTTESLASYVIDVFEYLVRQFQITIYDADVLFVQFILILHNPKVQNLIRTPLYTFEVVPKNLFKLFTEEAKLTKNKKRKPKSINITRGSIAKICSRSPYFLSFIFDELLLSNTLPKISGSVHHQTNSIYSQRTSFLTILFIETFNFAKGISHDKENTLSVGLKLVLKCLNHTFLESRKASLIMLETLYSLYDVSFITKQKLSFTFLKVALKVPQFSRSFFLCLESSNTFTFFYSETSASKSINLIANNMHELSDQEVQILFKSYSLSNKNIVLLTFEHFAEKLIEKSNAKVMVDELSKQYDFETLSNLVISCRHCTKLVQNSSLFKEVPEDLLGHFNILRNLVFDSKNEKRGVVTAQEIEGVIQAVLNLFASREETQTPKNWIALSALINSLSIKPSFKIFERSINMVDFDTCSNNVIFKSHCKWLSELLTPMNTELRAAVNDYIVKLIVWYLYIAVPDKTDLNAISEVLLHSKNELYKVILKLFSNEKISLTIDDSAAFFRSLGEMLSLVHEVEDKRKLVNHIYISLFQRKIHLPKETLFSALVFCLKFGLEECISTSLAKQLSFLPIKDSESIDLAFGVFQKTFIETNSFARLSILELIYGYFAPGFQSSLVWRLLVGSACCSDIKKHLFLTGSPWAALCYKIQKIGHFQVLLSIENGFEIDETVKTIKKVTFVPHIKVPLDVDLGFQENVCFAAYDILLCLALKHQSERNFSAVILNSFAVWCNSFQQCPISFDTLKQILIKSTLALKEQTLYERDFDKFCFTKHNVSDKHALISYFAACLIEHMDNLMLLPFYLLFLTKKIWKISFKNIFEGISSDKSTLIIFRITSLIFTEKHSIIENSIDFIAEATPYQVLFSYLKECLENETLRSHIEGTLYLLRKKFTLSCDDHDTTTILGFGSELLTMENKYPTKYACLVTEFLYSVFLDVPKQLDLISKQLLKIFILHLPNKTWLEFLFQINKVDHLVLPKYIKNAALEKLYTVYDIVNSSNTAAIWFKSVLKLSKVKSRGVFSELIKVGVCNPVIANNMSNVLASKDEASVLSIEQLSIILLYIKTEDEVSTFFTCVGLKQGINICINLRESTEEAYPLPMASYTMHALNTVSLRRPVDLPLTDDEKNILCELLFKELMHDNDRDKYNTFRFCANQFTPFIFFQMYTHFMVTYVFGLGLNEIEHLFSVLKQNFINLGDERSQVEHFIEKFCTTLLNALADHKSSEDKRKINFIEMFCFCINMSQISTNKLCEFFECSVTILEAQQDYSIKNLNFFKLLSCTLQKLSEYFDENTEIPTRLLVKVAVFIPTFIDMIGKLATFPDEEILINLFEVIYGLLLLFPEYLKCHLGKLLDFFNSFNFNTAVTKILQILSVSFELDYMLDIIEKLLLEKIKASRDLHLAPQPSSIWACYQCFEFILQRSVVEKVSHKRLVKIFYHVLKFDYQTVDFCCSDAFYTFVITLSEKRVVKTVSRLNYQLRVTRLILKEAKVDTEIEYNTIENFWLCLLKIVSKLQFLIDVIGLNLIQDLANDLALLVTSLPSTYRSKGIEVFLSLIPIRFNGDTGILKLAALETQRFMEYSQIILDALVNYLNFSCETKLKRKRSLESYGFKVGGCISDILENLSRIHTESIDTEASCRNNVTKILELLEATNNTKLKIELLHCLTKIYIRLGTSQSSFFHSKTPKFLSCVGEAIESPSADLRAAAEDIMKQCENHTGKPFQHLVLRASKIGFH